LEAIKSDIPVISSQNCGFADLVKSTPTFRYHDTQGFTNLILYFLHNPEERQKLLQNQKADLANHSWPKEVKKIIDLALQA
jgi:glycosyltransferase involved in cell wall biosynthesis